MNTLVLIGTQRKSILPNTSIHVYDVIFIFIKIWCEILSHLSLSEKFNNYKDK